MTDFIAEVTGQENTEEGNVVFVRVTGFGAEDGPLMTRAKARAIAATRFGRDSVSHTKEIDIEGKRGTDTVDIHADKSESLYTGPAKGVRERIKAFRKNGLFTEVKHVAEVETERAIKDERLQEVFGPLSSTVSTYKYRILVTTKYSFA